jgi:hypothetical protein
MGDWSITIIGTGCHHNDKPEIDANEATKYFVKRLKEQGHTIHHASFVSGGRDHTILDDDGHKAWA